MSPYFVYVSLPVIIFFSLIQRVADERTSKATELEQKVALLEVRET